MDKYKWHKVFCTVSDDLNREGQGFNFLVEDCVGQLWFLRQLGSNVTHFHLHVVKVLKYSCSCSFILYIFYFIIFPCTIQTHSTIVWENLFQTKTAERSLLWIGYFSNIHKIITISPLEIENQLKLWWKTATKTSTWRKMTLFCYEDKTRNNFVTIAHQHTLHK